MTRNLRTGVLGTATILLAGLTFGAALLAAIDGFGPAPAALAAVALLALPFVAAGLAMAQRPGFAVLGQAGVIAFGAGCVFGIVVCLYALIAGTFSVAGLRDELGSLTWAAEASLVPGAVAFGAATYVGGVLPRPFSACMVVGLLLGVEVIGASDLLQLLAVGLATLGLAGLGFALIPTPRPRRRRHRGDAAVTAEPQAREAGGHRPRPLVPGT